MMKKILMVLVVMLSIATPAAAVFYLNGTCVKTECPICGELITTWRDNSSTPYMYSLPSSYGGLCITYCDEGGICYQNLAKVVNILSLEICPKCHKKYGDVLRSAFADKLKEIQGENVQLKKENQRINKEREKKQLQKRRDDLIRQIEEIDKVPK